MTKIAQRMKGRSWDYIVRTIHYCEVVINYVMYIINSRATAKILKRGINNKRTVVIKWDNKHFLEGRRRGKKNKEQTEQIENR